MPMPSLAATSATVKAMGSRKGRLPRRGDVPGREQFRPDLLNVFIADDVITSRSRGRDAAGLDQFQDVPPLTAEMAG